jgi:hypothetical protein
MTSRPSLREIITVENTKFPKVDTITSMPFGRITKFPKGSLANTYNEWRSAENYRKSVEEIKPQQFPLERESRRFQVTDTQATFIDSIIYTIRNRILNEERGISYVTKTRSIWTSQSHIEKYIIDFPSKLEIRDLSTKIGNAIFDSITSISTAMMEEDAANARQARTNISKRYPNGVVPLKKTLYIETSSSETRKEQFLARCSVLIQYNIKKIVENEMEARNVFDRQIEHSLPRVDDFASPLLRKPLNNQRKILPRQELVKEESEELPPPFF